MKIFILLMLFFMSFSANACVFPHEGLIEKHNHQFNWLMIFSFFIMVTSLLIRSIYQKSRLWVPIIFMLFLGYYPFGLLVLEGYGVISGGACGRPGLIAVGQVCLLGVLIILSYECFKYIRYKRSL